MRAECLLAASLLLCGCASSRCSSGQDELPAELGPLEPKLGYTAAVVLEGLVQPTQLQFDATGRLYVLEGGPQSPKAMRVFEPDLSSSPGFAIETDAESTGLLVFGDGDRLLFASRGRIDSASRSSGGWAAPTPWITGLPVGPEHANNGLALGSDGNVYFGVGSSCDVCDETDARHATLMRAPSADAAPTPEVFARGLRNAYDVGFASGGELLVTDNGPECCDGSSSCTGPGPDRLVQVKPGDDLGWPGAFLGRSTLPEPLVRLPIHGGATGFATALVAGCPEVAFVTLWGSEDPSSQRGRRVLRIELHHDASGLSAASPEDLLGPSGVAHPIDVAVSPAGGIYVLDFGGRVLQLRPPAACP